MFNTIERFRRRLSEGEVLFTALSADASGWRLTK